MPLIQHRIRVVNPGRRRTTTANHARNAHKSLKQLLYFGTPSQRASAASRLGCSVPEPFGGKAKYQRGQGARSRKRNIGGITILGLNPGRRRKVNKLKESIEFMPFVKRRKRVRRVKVNRARPRRRNRRRVNAHHRRRTAPRVVLMNPRRRRNSRRRNSYKPRVHRRYHRRRNPSLSNIGTQVIGVIAGAAATKIIVGMLPASFQSGILKYISTAVVASALGWGVRKYAHKEAFGTNLTVGGYTLLGLEVINDLVPGVAGYSALGLRGLGSLITPSSFYTPQVPIGGSMTSFVTPSAISAAINSAIPSRNPSKAGLAGLAVVRRRA